MGVATEFLMIKKEVFEKELFRQFPDANKELVDTVLSYAQSALDEKLKRAVEDICSIVITQYDKQIAENRVRIEKLEDEVRRLSVLDWQLNVS